MKTSSIRLLYLLFYVLSTNYSHNPIYFEKNQSVGINSSTLQVSIWTNFNNFPIQLSPDLCEHVKFAKLIFFL